jgi:hypothetical protein
MNCITARPNEHLRGLKLEHENPQFDTLMHPAIGPTAT